MSSFVYPFQSWGEQIRIWMLVGANFVVKAKPEGELVTHGHLLKLGWHSTPIPDLNPHEMSSEPGKNGEERNKK